MLTALHDHRNPVGGVKHLKQALFVGEEGLVDENFLGLCVLAAHPLEGFLPVDVFKPEKFVVTYRDGARHGGRHTVILGNLPHGCMA